MQMLTSNRNRTTTMAGSAGAGSEDGSTAQQGFRVRLDEDPHVYEFSVHASGAHDDMTGARHPAAGAGVSGLLHRPSCTYGKSSGHPLPEGDGKTYVQTIDVRREVMRNMQHR